MFSCVAVSRPCSHTVALVADFTRLERLCSMKTSARVLAHSAASFASGRVMPTITSRLSGTGSMVTCAMNNAPGSAASLKGGRSWSLRRSITFSPRPRDFSTRNCVL